MELTLQHFEQLDIRTGTIKEARVFEKAIKPAYQLTIDFGEEIGIKKSSAQITTFYQPQQLVGQQVIALINVAPRQIANYVSECLVLGAVNNTGGVILLQPQQPAPNGLKIA
ncbi:MAG: tRNA-binding protein [Bacteroidia bacterium]|nr:tRNA-binding protein [Bacteroidia bacterium]MBP9690154.1 tRNA-binding protein [Bacteroidia bacterium]